MYTILIVDDERPAQTFLKAICQKYCPAFDTILLSGSADEALRVMAQQVVHVLVTDISMPGTNGISLAQRVRKLHPQTHIVIVSGYAEFEFARGAIQAGVDDYLLKPVEIQSFREILDRIREKLDEETASFLEDTVSRLISGESISDTLLTALFPSRRMRFVLLRQGNLSSARFAKFRSTQLRHIHQAGWMAFYGRDVQETILLRSDIDRLKRFPDELSDLLKASFADQPCTAIYAHEDDDISALPDFLTHAASRMVNTVVIGKEQQVALNAPQTPLQPSGISAAIKKRIASFVETSNTRMLKEQFVSLAIEWAQNDLPQIQAEDMCYQLILYAADLGVPGPKKKREQILREANELYGSASSYGDLMASLYALIFEEGFIRDKNVSANELCEYTLNYIRENYAQPLSIPRICTDIGISQTYLSRLLRKYAGTTFNTFLTQCRMDAAKKMLREHPDILLHEVAACVGYDDQSYFSKIFRNETGMTPSQYAASFSANFPPASGESDAP